MSAPLDRETQIQLMSTAKERQESVMRNWLQNPAVHDEVMKRIPRKGDHSDHPGKKMTAAGCR